MEVYTSSKFWEVWKYIHPYHYKASKTKLKFSLNFSTKKSETHIIQHSIKMSENGWRAVDGRVGIGGYRRMEG
jgi:hypothetical protein